MLMHKVQLIKFAHQQANTINIHNNNNNIIKSLFILVSIKAMACKIAEKYTHHLHKHSLINNIKIYIQTLKFIK